MKFGDVLERNEAVLENKKCVLYRRKIGYFPKRLTNEFGQKFELSLLVVFSKEIGPEMMFGDGLDRKEAFLD